MHEYIRETLYQARSRPEQHTADPNARYGKTSSSSEPAANIVFPEHDSPFGRPGDDDLETRGSMLKTKRARQRREELEASAALARENGRARRAPAAQEGGVADAMRAAQQRSHIFPLAVSETQARRGMEPVGASANPFKRRGQQEQQKPNVFGRVSRPDEGGAAECIRGDDSVSPFDRDANERANLARKGSHRPSRAGGDVPANVSFGRPSIKADRNAPAQKSIASNAAYGDEAHGADLLYPTRGVQDGSEQFEQPRERSQVRDVFSQIGYTFEDSEFYTICKAAEQRNGGVLSVAAFRDAMNEIKLGM